MHFFSIKSKAIAGSHGGDASWKRKKKQCYSGQVKEAYKCQGYIVYNIYNINIICIYIYILCISYILYIPDVFCSYCPTIWNCNVGAISLALYHHWMGECHETNYHVGAIGVLIYFFSPDVFRKRLMMAGRSLCPLLGKRVKWTRGT